MTRNSIFTADTELYFFQILSLYQEAHHNFSQPIPVPIRSGKKNKKDKHQN